MAVLSLYPSQVKCLSLSQVGHRQGVTPTPLGTKTFICFDNRPVAAVGDLKQSPSLVFFLPKASESMKAFFPATGAIDESSPMEGESQRDRSDRVQPLLSEKKMMNDRHRVLREKTN